MDIRGIEQSIREEVERRMGDMRKKVEADVRSDLAAQISKGHASHVGAHAPTAKRRGRPPGSARIVPSEGPEGISGAVGAMASGRAKETTKCSVTDCTKPAIARGLCSRHYQQARYHERKQHHVPTGPQAASETAQQPQQGNQ